MEKLVEAVMRTERKSDRLDRAVLAFGVLSLCIALLGTFAAATDKDVANAGRDMDATTV